jgi:hypothetical protein
VEQYHIFDIVNMSVLPKYIHQTCFYINMDKQRFTKIKGKKFTTRHTQMWVWRLSVIPWSSEENDDLIENVYETNLLYGETIHEPHANLFIFGSTGIQTQGLVAC